MIKKQIKTPEPKNNNDQIKRKHECHRDLSFRPACESKESREGGNRGGLGLGLGGNTASLAGATAFG